jgi:hypothetical protein
MTIRCAGGTALVACLLFSWGCGDSSTVEETIVSCQDGLDNDKNGLVDCKDPGCGKHSFCDPSVQKGCGDGVVTAPERCDTKIAVGSPGACPTSCDDGNACTKDSLGNPGTCSAACVAIPVTSCENGDGCCPTGCTSGNDNDCKASCGNGVLDTGETCDTKIPAGAVGTCPTAASCNDGNACTIDALLNDGTCTASCGHQAMIVCSGTKSDGCCPSGCNAATDADCSPSCGNGVLEPKESCDTKIAAGQDGACPTSCDDKNACTKDQLLNGGTCAATCTNQAITQCSGLASDGCCPTGCSASNDADCSASCGNGLVEPKETCDTKIAAGQPGACPTSCNDGNSCTIDTLLNAGTCSASCSNVKLAECKSGDGCCPAGCNAANDSDCTAVCGNGVLELGEDCDIKIAAGQPGGCPNQLTCDDKNACTLDTVPGAGTCKAACAHTTITTCQGGDGCCPPTCNSLSDSDCPIQCGNGLVEKGEICDTKIAAGQPGACATTATCKTQGCTVATLLNAGTCQASCVYSPPTETCSGQVADGCCPSTCTVNTDVDCACGTTCSGETSDGCCPIGCYYYDDIDCLCGNGIVDPGETCDIGMGTYRPWRPRPRTASSQPYCPTDYECQMQHGYSGCWGAVGSDCNVSCAIVITTCSGSNYDNCCPSGCQCEGGPTTDDYDCCNIR